MRTICNATYIQHVRNASTLVSGTNGSVVHGLCAWVCVCVVLNCFLYCSIESNRARDSSSVGDGGQLIVAHEQQQTEKLGQHLQLQQTRRERRRNVVIVMMLVHVAKCVYFRDEVVDEMRVERVAVECGEEEIEELLYVSEERGNVQ